ncbi:MAG: Trk system potassium transporter TrkA [Alphaproteobacteria bacterium]|nr:Trk system potassium transporter TrkA [Alphaproteobacteria bacterium]
MRVIICGAGKVGATLAKYLVQDGNDVVVIDNDMEKLTDLGSKLDIQTIQGFASYPSILERAEATSADMLIAVSASDEVNMITCQAANCLFKVPTIIARLRSREYTNPKWKNLYSRDAFPIDVVISPEMEIAKAIRRNISFPGTSDVLTLAGDKVYMLGIRCDEMCPFVNASLRQLTDLFPDLNAVVAGIVRDNNLIVPNGDTKVQENDELYVFVQTENVSRLLTLAGIEQQKVSSALILGGNDIGLSLAKHLERSGAMRVTIVEPNEERAKLLASELENTTVINGNILDPEVLEEADIQIVDTVIAVSFNDEDNILASLMAKRYGAEQTACVLEKTLYSQMVSDLGIDVIVDPKDTMVSSILQHIRRGKIYSAYSIRSGMCEVLETDIDMDFPWCGKSLKEIKMPVNSKIGAIVRNGVSIPLRGDTTIEYKDRVMLFVNSEDAKLIEKLFNA